MRYSQVPCPEQSTPSTEDGHALFGNSQSPLDIEHVPIRQSLSVLHVAVVEMVNCRREVVDIQLSNAVSE